MMFLEGENTPRFRIHLPTLSFTQTGLNVRDRCYCITIFATHNSLGRKKVSVTYGDRDSGS
jgi:hypothetical protein